MPPTFKNSSAADFVAVKPKPKRKTVSKPKTKPKFKNVPFRFLELPTEIRYMVYDLLLIESLTDLTYVTSPQGDKLHRGIMVKTDGGRGWKGNSYNMVHPKSKEITHFCPKLLRVCKFIHAEASAVLYRQTFYFESALALKKFLFVIRPANRLLLNKIVLRGWSYEEWLSWSQALGPVFDRLASAVNLTSLRLERHTKSSRDGVWDGNSHLVPPKAPSEIPIKRFLESAGYWGQFIDNLKGKGTARGILSFSDLVFGSQEEIDRKDTRLEARKKVFLDKLIFD